MSLHTRINRFNAGLWSGLLDGRTDLEDYEAALKICKGFIPLKYGPAERMRGFEYGFDAKVNDATLIPFKFDQDTGYIIETDGTYMRFYDTSQSTLANTRVTVDVDDVSDWAASTAYRYGELARYGNTLATGTISSSGTAITGVGTAFSTEFEVGDFIQEKGNDQIAEITGITDDTNMTVDVTFSPAAAGDNFAKVTLWAYDTLGGGTSAGTFTPGSWHALTQTSTAGTFIYEIPSPTAHGPTQGKPHIANVNDVMYLVNESREPLTLSRFGATDWRLERLSYTLPPVLDQNTSSTTIAVSAYTGTGVTLTASTSTFVSGHINTYWEIREDRVATKATKDFTANGNSSAISVFGDWTLTTSGIWDADVELYRSLDGFVTSELIETVEGASNSNYVLTGTETNPLAQYRITVANRTVGTASDICTLNVGAGEVKGSFKITAVAGGTSATADWVQSVDSKAGAMPATTKWSEAAFSSVQGWPAAVAFYQGRIFLGGTTARKQTIWGSAIDNFNNFGTSYINVLDSDGVQYTISSVEQNKIRWMVGLQDLLIGTTGEEFSVRGADSNAISANSAPLIQAESNVGSRYMQPEIAQNAVLFSNGDGSKVHAMRYDWRERGYASEDLTRLNEGAVSSKFASYTKDPHSIYWCGSGGAMFGLVYNNKEEVQAWFERWAPPKGSQAARSSFKSQTSTYDGEEDDLWVIVDTYMTSSLSSNKQQICRLSKISTNRDKQPYLDLNKTETSNITNPDPNLGSDYSEVTVAGHLGQFSSLTGTASSSGTTVTGTGTAFSTELSVGDYIRSGTAVQRVASIASDTSLETTNAFSPALSSASLELGEGRNDVYALVDGMVQGPFQLHGDRFSVEGNPSTVLYGLPYDAEIETLKLEANAGDGYSRNKVKKAINVGIGFKDTLGGRVGIKYNEKFRAQKEKSHEIDFRTDNDNMDDPIPLRTGDTLETLPPGNHRYMSVFYRQDQPLPCTITYLAPQILPKGQ